MSLKLLCPSKYFFSVVFEFKITKRSLAFMKQLLKLTSFLLFVTFNKFQFPCFLILKIAHHCCVCLGCHPCSAHNPVDCISVNADLHHTLVLCIETVFLILVKTVITLLPKSKGDVMKLLFSL